MQIGAATTIERDLARRRAERCLRAMPYALREGVLPGGGAAAVAQQLYPDPRRVGRFGFYADWCLGVPDADELHRHVGRDEGCHRVQQQLVADQHFGG